MQGNCAERGRSRGRLVLSIRVWGRCNRAAGLGVELGGSLVGVVAAAAVAVVVAIAEVAAAMGHRIAVEGSPAEDIRAAGCTAADTAGHTEAADRAGERDGLGIADQLLGGTGIVQPEAEEIERKEEDRRDIAGPDAAAEAASHSRTRAGSGSGPGSLAGPGFRTAAAGGIEGAGSSFWWCC